MPHCIDYTTGCKVIVTVWAGTITYPVWQVMLGDGAGEGESSGGAKAREMLSKKKKRKKNILLCLPPDKLNHAPSSLRTSGRLFVWSSCSQNCLVSSGTLAAEQHWWNPLPSLFITPYRLMPAAEPPRGCDLRIVFPSNQCSVLIQDPQAWGHFPNSFKCSDPHKTKTN